jgi:hypothetical protein
MSRCDSAEHEPEPEPEPELVCTKEPAPGVLLPLEKGNYWDYAVYSFMGTVTDTIRLEVIGAFETAFQGQLINTYGTVFSFQGQIPDSTQRLLSNLEGGLYDLGVATTKDTALVKELWYPYPAEIGSTGKLTRIHFDSSDDKGWSIIDTVYSELKAKDVDISAPIGLFQAYHYNYLNPPAPDVSLGDNIDDYYVPGIGMVGQVQRGSDIDSALVKRSFYLVDYCLKRKG